MNLITLDFETYYAQDYSLTKLTTEEYIRSKKFEVIGVGVKVGEVSQIASLRNTANTVRTMWS
jgi:hypothetical protein